MNLLIIFSRKYLVDSVIFLCTLMCVSCALSGVVPLTYDEAWNYSHISSNGWYWVTTNYPFPNNHVLFSILQSIIIPNDAVSYWPSIIRIPNQVWSLLLIITIKQLCIWNKIQAPYICLLILTVYLASPVATTYFFVSRGYTVGLFFSILSTFLLLRNYLFLSGILIALSAYTVPTFGFVLPGIFLYLLIFERTENSMKKLLGYFIFSVACTVLLYLPIIKSVLSHSESFKPFTEYSSFLSSILMSISSVGHQTDSVYFGLALIALNLSLGILSFCSQKSFAYSSNFRTGTIFLYSWVSVVLIVSTGFILNKMSLPFIRSVFFVPILIQISTLFFFVDLNNASDNGYSVKSTYYQNSIAGVFILQILCGLWIFINSFFIGTPNNYPHFSQLTPSPIERAIHANIIDQHSQLTSSIWNEPVLSLYQKAYKFKVEYLSSVSLSGKCISGEIAPLPTQIIMLNKSDDFSLCY